MEQHYKRSCGNCSEGVRRRRPLMGDGERRMEKEETWFYICKKTKEIRDKVWRRYKQHSS